MQNLEGANLCKGRSVPSDPDLLQLLEDNSRESVLKIPKPDQYQNQFLVTLLTN